MAVISASAFFSTKFDLTNEQDANDLENLTTQLDKITPLVNGGQDIVSAPNINFIDSHDNTFNRNELGKIFNNEKKEKKCDNLGLSSNIVENIYYNVWSLNIDKIIKLNNEYNIIKKLNKSQTIYSLDNLQIFLSQKSRQVSTHKEWKSIDFLVYFANESLMASVIGRLGERNGLRKNVNNLYKTIDWLQKNGNCRLANCKKQHFIRFNHIKYATRLLLEKNNDNILNVSDLDISNLKMDYLQFDPFIFSTMLKKYSIFKPWTHLFNNNTKLNKKKIDKIYKYLQNNKFKKLIKIDSNPWFLSEKLSDYSEHFQNGWKLLHENAKKAESSAFKRKFLRHHKKIIETVQDMRNDQINTFEQCLNNKKNPCNKFITHNMYDPKLKDYILQLSGLIPPTIIINKNIKKN